MKKFILYSVLLLVMALQLQAQEKNLVRKGNELLKNKKAADSEIMYKKALKYNPNSISANYNLGNSVFEQKRFKESIAQYDLVAKTTGDKNVKSASYHNMGNALLQEKKLDEAIKAYEDALRNNPNDKQTRHNLILAKRMKQQQKSKNKKNNKSKDKNKDKNEDKNEDKKDNRNNKKDESEKQKQDKKNQKQQRKKKQNRLSKEEIKRILEAMKKEEDKIQKKVKKKKVKAKRVKTDKDW